MDKFLESAETQFHAIRNRFQDAVRTIAPQPNPTEPATSQPLTNEVLQVKFRLAEAYANELNHNQTKLNKEDLEMTLHKIRAADVTKTVVDDVDALIERDIDWTTDSYRGFKLLSPEEYLGREKIATLVQKITMLTSVPLYPHDLIEIIILPPRTNLDRGKTGGYYDADTNTILLIADKIDKFAAHEITHTVMDGYRKHVLKVTREFGHQTLDEGLAVYINQVIETEDLSASSEYLREKILVPLNMTEMPNWNQLPEYRGEYTFGPVLMELLVKQQGFEVIKGLWNAQATEFQLQKSKDVVDLDKVIGKCSNYDKLLKAWKEVPNATTPSS